VSEQGRGPLQLSTGWGSRRIPYSLQLEPRRDLVITVHPDLRVEVRAPDSKPLDHVLRRIHARRSWIAQQLLDFERLTPLPPPRFVSGETILYLGREYRLRVERDGHGVSLHSGRLHVRVAPGAGQRAVRHAVDGWFRSRARDVFIARAVRLQREIGLLKEVKPAFRVRRMTRRWGSCTAGGTVTLNPALIQAPASCVDYVLVHEMVHLLEPTHSPLFYRALTRAMPDWRDRRERLANAAIRWA
jgi:predicted metal-dependent hydrolase